MTKKMPAKLFKTKKMGLRGEGQGRKKREIREIM